MRRGGRRGYAKKKKTSPLDTLIDLLPFELHPSKYKFLDPGTKLKERLERGEVGVNPLDEFAPVHDIVYASRTGDRRKADRVLAKRALSQMLEDDTPRNERFLAMMTACCMVSKITLEKLVSRVSKELKRCDNKKKIKLKSGEKTKDGEKEKNCARQKKKKSERAKIG